MGWSLPGELKRWGRLTLQALGLVPSEGKASQEGIALALAAWLPFAVISMVKGLAAGALDPYFLDFSVHARFLVAVTVVHMGSALLVRIEKETLRRLADEGLAPAPSLAGLEPSVGRWMHVRRRAILLGIVCLILGQILFWGAVTTPGVAEEHAGQAAGIRWAWLTWVALPIFYFVGFRALLLWGTWCGILLRVSRLPLRLSAAHPDYAGGLEFVVRPSLAFCLVVAGLASVLSATWGTELVFEGASLSAYGKLLTAWVLIALFVVMGPLVLLTPGLLQARRRGRWGFGNLATSYTRQFEEKWIRSRPEGPLLGTQDLQSLADLGGSFQVVRGMRVILFQGKDLLVVLLAAAGPMLPLLLTQVPLREILKRLLEIMMR